MILVTVRPEAAGGGREGGIGEVHQVLGTLAEDSGEGEDGEEEGDDHLHTFRRQRRDEFWEVANIKSLQFYQSKIKYIYNNYCIIFSSLYFEQYQ